MMLIEVEDLSDEKVFKNITEQQCNTNRKR